MNLEPIQRESLVDQAVRAIFGHIQKNDLKAGTVLPSESKLADNLGVSRPVIREAMRTLVGKGVVDMVNGVGAVVRPLDGRVLAEHFNRLAATRVNNAFELEEARHGLEMHAAMLAAQRRTEDDLRDLEAILVKMRAAVGDKQVYGPLNAEFHKVIARAARNPILETMVGALLDSLGAAMAALYAQLLPADHWTTIHRYHEEIFAHIRDREPERARDRTLEHLTYSMQMYLEREAGLPGGNADRRP
jgi:GntR family transcriptional repressor for pyruvate dehydrogenase complex